MCMDQCCSSQYITHLCAEDRQQKRHKPRRVHNQAWERKLLMSTKPNQRRSTLYKDNSGEFLDQSVLRVPEIYKDFTLFCTITS
ncbi:hypothetical protein EPR50_G00112710 [Perca flavescens]|uniref:Uncharacterized protein n=1 Tax=Perca flavescens TaxID=8167 RepID=A0A484CZC6_PERFV|nr:hypothetical protein EPR50_G00112710 [Perca flavescens]